MKGFKRMKLLTGLLSMLLIMGMGSSVVLADVPTTVSYQCKLESAGEDLTQVDMVFYLLADDEDTAEAAIWTYTATDVDVINGIVSIELGKDAAVPLTEGLVASAEYIGIKVGDGAMMQPPTKLTSSMYAIRAKYADEFTQGAIAFDDSNLSDNIVAGSSLKDESVSTEKIKNGTITSEDLADGSITNEKITTLFRSVDEDVTGPSKEYELLAGDQGLVLVEGDITIQLPTPANENKGARYTIKKVDDGITRSCSDCEIETNIITIKCGTYSDNIKENMCIDRRIDKVYLEYKNAFASFVSDGSNWFIVESNPPQDIYSPVPGNEGTVEDVELSPGQPVTLTWTKADDCDRRRCEDSCPDSLYYMPYFSKGEKLDSLDAVREKGISCRNEWLSFDPSQTTLTTVCDPTDAEQVAEPYNDTYKVNVVVKDKAGNLAIYCPPGDNTPPEAPASYWVNPINDKHYVNLLWDRAEDKAKEGITPTEKDQLTYSIYYVEGEDEEGCLSNLVEELPEQKVGCEHVQNPHAKVKAITDFDPGTRPATATIYKESETKATVDVGADGENDPGALKPGTTYSFTILVEDNAGNRMQYDVIDTKTDE